MDDQSDDPLNVGNVISINLPTFSTKKCVQFISKSTSNVPVDIFSVSKTKSKKPRIQFEDNFVNCSKNKKLSNISNGVHERRRHSFKELTKNSAHPFTKDTLFQEKPLSNSPSLPEMSTLSPEDDSSSQNDLYKQLSRPIPKSKSQYSNVFSNDNLLLSQQTSSVDFTDFFIKEIVNTTPDVNSSFFENRVNMFDRAISVLENMFVSLKERHDKSVLRRSQLEQNWTLINRKLLSIKRCGLEKNRPIAALHKIYLHKLQKVQEIKKDSIRSQMDLTVDFVEFLKSMKEQFIQEKKIMPTIHLESFRKKLESMDDEPKERRKNKKHKISIIKSHLQDFVPLKVGEGDWYDRILHPETKTGQIIQRFEENIEQLCYDDVALIIQHIQKQLIKNSKKKRSAVSNSSSSMNLEMNSTEGEFDNNQEENNEFDDVGSHTETARIEQLLFDLAWQKKPFPFGIGNNRKMGHRIKPKLPVTPDMFPAVIGSALLPKEWAYTSFSSLNGMAWPLKPAVDLIFNMFILTNPFEIAQCFWDMIQATAQCMQKILVINEGINPDDVEIDFDSLFPMLMICVFTFGLDEWLDNAIFTISFNEQVPDDPQLQFSMTYLEGLLTHIMALDPKALKKKSIDMRNKWAEEEPDPLGVI